MTSEDIKVKAFDTILEWSKQLITIASATIVLSATFVKDIFSDTIVHQGWLFASWILFIFSIVVGILVIGSLAAYLNTGDGSQLDVYKPSIWGTALAQGVFFLCGMGTFLWFVYSNVSAHPIEPSAKKSLYEHLTEEVKKGFEQTASKADLKQLSDKIDHFEKRVEELRTSVSQAEVRIGKLETELRRQTAKRGQSRKWTSTAKRAKCP